MTTFINLKICLINLFIMLSFSHGLPNRKHSVRPVNLGGWLVTEGWIKPSLFDGIPNKQFLDGTALQFKSVTTKKYLCVECGGGTIVVANCRNASNGYFLQAKTEEVVTADASQERGWGDDDPTVFVMTIASTIQGEFQVTNGYGPQRLPKL